MKTFAHLTIWILVSFSICAAQADRSDTTRYFKDFDLFALSGTSPLPNAPNQYPYIELRGTPNGTITLYAWRSKNDLVKRVFRREKDYYWTLDSVPCSNLSACIDVFYHFPQQSKMIGASCIRKTSKKGNRWHLRHLIVSERYGSKIYFFDAPLPSLKLLSREKRLKRLAMDKRIGLTYKTRFKLEGNTLIREFSRKEKGGTGEETKVSCYELQGNFESYWFRLEKDSQEIDCQ